MPHTYLQDVKEVINALTGDKGLTLEGKLILLGMVTDHVAAVTNQLEGELAACEGGLT